MMEILEENKPSLTWLPSFFIIAIFFGNVWLIKLTLPLSMLCIPLLFIVFSPFKNLSLQKIPSALYFLFGLIAIFLVQIFMRQSLTLRADFAIWDPILFATLTIFCLRNVVMSEKLLKHSLYIGGVITGAIMLCMIFSAPPKLFLPPNQNIYYVKKKHSEEIKPTQKNIARQDVYYVEIKPPKEIEIQEKKLVDQPETYYSVKNKARNALGVSNYIAVFLVFLFCVSLFSQNFIISGVMFLFTLFTLSRTGFLMMFVVSVSYFLHQKKEITVAKLTSGLLMTTTLIYSCLLYFRDAIEHWKIPASISDRFLYWASGLDVMMRHPIIGSPRSYFLSELNYGVTWHPHNSFLWVSANFGLIGVIIYIAYVMQVFKTINQLARTSKLWSGVLMGFSVILAWSYFSVIVLTPAYEILFAALYILANNQLNMQHPKYLATGNLQKFPKITIQFLKLLKKL